MAKAKKSETSLTLEEKLEQALIADDEQPYNVPENWCWVELQLLCSIPITDGTHKTPKYCDADNGIPFISAKDVTGQYINWENIKYITMELHEELHKRLAPQINDILLAKNGTTGVAAIVDTEKIFDIYVTLAILRINSNIAVPKYVLHLINSPICKIQFDEHLTGIGVPNLHLRDIKVTQIPFPPLAEQQRIVDRIESLFSKLDEVKENVQNVINVFENRKSAILHKAFNGELSAKWREENNRNIAEWKNKKLGEYAFVTKLAGFEYTKNIAPNLVNNGVPLFKGKNVQEGTLILKFESFIPKSVSDELPRSKLTKKCLLTPYVGTIGNIALFDGSFEAHLGSNVGKIEIEKETFEEYLLYYLRSDFGYKELTKQKKATAQESISIQAIRDVITILPSLEEQHEIVRILDSTLSKEQQAKEKAEEVLERIELIKKSILARAFRGKLGTNNPDEESSLELLKMVLSEDKDEKTSSKSKSK